MLSNSYFPNLKSSYPATQCVASEKKDGRQPLPLFKGDYRT